MRFGRGLQAEFESVDVLFKNPRNGNVEIVAIDVRMAILPIPSSSNDIGQDLQQPYRQRYGGYWKRHARTSESATTSFNRQRSCYPVKD